MRTPNEQIRRELTGGMPTGQNKLAGKEFRVIRKPVPPKVESLDIIEGFELFSLPYVSSSSSR